MVIEHRYNSLVTGSLINIVESEQWNDESILTLGFGSPILNREIIESIRFVI